MKKLRLLLTAECNRACAGCCNRQYDLSALPACRSYRGYREIMLTGGEPMLDPPMVSRVALAVREQTFAPVYLYTAKTDEPLVLFTLLLTRLDGVTITLHDKSDVEPFRNFAVLVRGLGHLRSLRVNVFRPIPLEAIADVLALASWRVKADMEWIENCPLPDDEVFMRYAREGE